MCRDNDDKEEEWKADSESKAKKKSLKNERNLGNIEIF